jgi:hypothetical protein
MEIIKIEFDNFERVAKITYKINGEYHYSHKSTLKEGFISFDAINELKLIDIDKLSNLLNKR